MRNVIPLLIVWAISVLPLAAKADEAKPMTRSEVVEIARQYVKDNLPNDSRVLSFNADVVDKGESWLVLFNPPGELVTGGVPEIAIDKRTRAVSKVTRAQ